jgi:S1-C subfamily serine protease
MDGTPADGHLRVGDVITAVDGKPVGLSSDLVAATTGLPEGRTVTLTVQRDTGPPTQVQIELERVGQLGRPGMVSR